MLLALACAAMRVSEGDPANTMNASAPKVSNSLFMAASYEARFYSCELFMLARPCPLQSAP